MKHIKNYVRAQKAIIKHFTPQLKNAENKRELRKLEKEKSTMLARLDEADKAPKLESLKFRVDWKKSRTWGFNPTAEAFVNGVYCGKYTASGCGYDKLSAACSHAMKEDVNSRGTQAIILRWIIENWTKLDKEKPYALDYHYKYHPFPSLCFSGKGIETLYSLFRRFGWKTLQREETKTADFIYFSKS